MRGGPTTCADSTLGLGSQRTVLSALTAELRCKGFALRYKVRARQSFEFLRIVLEGEAGEPECYVWPSQG